MRARDSLLRLGGLVLSAVLLVCAAAEGAVVTRRLTTGLPPQQGSDDLPQAWAAPAEQPPIRQFGHVPLFPTTGYCPPDGAGCLVRGLARSVQSVVLGICHGDWRLRYEEDGSDYRPSKQ